MLAVLIIPTGLGAAIGGHAGDGNPAAKLLARCCDSLITHPNVVNASDINEMPDNVLYVEGSMLDRFLHGEIELEPVRTYNKILVAANHPVTEETVNAVSAARATIGADAKIIELPKPLRMIGRLAGTYATGEVRGANSLISNVRHLNFDALAIHTPIEVDRNIALNYYRSGGINPWGGVEAIASKSIARALNKPVAHAPLESTAPDDRELYLIFQERVHPRIAAEAVSNCYLHCVLKGLHRAPRIGKGVASRDVDILISPLGCWGPPHEACAKIGIPVVSVRENPVCAPVQTPPHTIVESYLEAAGLIMAMQAGVSRSSVSPKLPPTSISRSP